MKVKHMRAAALIVVITFALFFTLWGKLQRPTQVGCLEWLHSTGSASGRDGIMLDALEPQRRLTKECFQESDNEIRDALQRLTDAGRLTHPRNEFVYPLVAQFRWFSDEGGGTKGIYVYHQPAFDQAKRSWFTSVSFRKGSDKVVAPQVTFDESVVGYRARIGGFSGRMDATTVKVVKLLDSHTLEVSEKATGEGEMSRASFTPTDYDDNLCLCHLN